MPRAPIWRAVAFLLLWASAGQAIEPPPFGPSPAFTPAGPAMARGALVWMHGSYDTDAFSGSPPEPAVIARFAANGWDIWRFDRSPGRDPIAAGGDALVLGLRGLRTAGYRKLIVAGHSRGAFIALAVLREPGLVDGLALFSPAAHGSQPERRGQALADFSAQLDAATTQPGMRLLLAQFHGDTLEPDAMGRLLWIYGMCQRAGCIPHSILAPAKPTGHNGVYEPDFDRLFGPDVASFLDPISPPDAPRPPSRP